MERPGSRDMDGEAARLSEREVSESNPVALPSVASRDSSTTLRSARNDSKNMNERYIKWYTPWLSREFEMIVFGNGGGLPLILFPTSFGRYYQTKDFGLVGSVSGYVDAGRLTVYCPDAIDLESFYNKSIHPADRMRTHNAYENLIVRDVFDLARRECNCHRVAVSGASLGAYHAANIAFRHPDAVSHLISLSGSFDISSFFDGYHDDNRGVSQSANGVEESLMIDLRDGTWITTFGFTS
jgi:esterase/lipase superfamily enzyme